MKYDLIQTRISKDFNELGLGELFLDKLQVPYIKIYSLVSADDVRIVCNAICISSGNTRYFHEDEIVWIPTKYHLEIEM